MVSSAIGLNHFSCSRFSFGTANQFPNKDMETYYELRMLSLSLGLSHLLQAGPRWAVIREVPPFWHDFCQAPSHVGSVHMVQGRGVGLRKVR